VGGGVALEAVDEAALAAAADDDDRPHQPLQLDQPRRRRSPRDPRHVGQRPTPTKSSARISVPPAIRTVQKRTRWSFRTDSTPPPPVPCFGSP